MVKHEIKVELSNSTSIQEIIEKTYFEEGQMGKILGRKHYLTIDESDEINYTIFKGLNNATVRITNEIIDGSMRFMVDETEGDVRLYPISVYCIPKGEKEFKYSFY
jgi:hypothetical protein